MLPRGPPGGNKTQGPPPPEKIPRGPQAARFNPETDGPERAFKGGMKNGTEPKCKKRYQQISVTALGNLTTSASRILQ